MLIQETPLIKPASSPEDFGLVNRQTTFSKYFELKYLWLTAIKPKCLKLITIVQRNLLRKNTYSDYKNFGI